MNKESAISDNLKKSVVVAEVRRRLLNQDPECGVCETEVILNEFDVRMLRSGYDSNERRRVIVDGCIGHMRIKEKNVELYRDSSKGFMSRTMKKMGDKQSWFKQKRELGGLMVCPNIS